MKGTKKIRNSLLLTLLLNLSVIAGFHPESKAQQNENAQTLKVALLPILDAFPFYVAESQGYFADYGVDVKAVPVASGLERDQLMQSGAIDGMLNEMITTANFNRNRIQVKSVISARKAYRDYPLFRLLSAPGVSFSATGDLAGVPIGVSKNTIIEYVTDRLLTAEGLEAKTIVKKSVPVIPERYQLLLQGQLKAATLPDPLAKSAMVKGAGEIVDDAAYPGYSVSVLSFNIDALKNKASAVRLFLKAWDRAAAAINQNPETFRGLLLKKIRVPKNVQQTYKIPPYPLREVPDAGQWADVMNWMTDKGLLESALSYDDSITAEYLPVGK
ncbi:MAG: ABC transporter substrate-binding protein [Desulfobacteraceae bacterium]|jgi:NitT/TauT family transport system substrate-binding protein|nr:ABC transporter substrate-binding protein [Desulfobacteraceae bacterium]